MSRTKYISLYGILIALALVLSYVESLIPAFFAIPGMKLGLANIVIIIALYKLDLKAAFIINVIRVIVVFALFSNASSLMFSIAGAVLSYIVMVFLKLSKRCSMWVVSVVGAVSHNVAQVIVAMLLFDSTSLGYYLIVLWFTGIITGAGVGIISSEIIKRLPVGEGFERGSK